MASNQLIYDLVLETRNALKGVEKMLDKSKKQAEKDGEESGKKFGKGFTEAVKKELKSLSKQIKESTDKGLNAVGRTSFKDLLNTGRQTANQIVESFKRIPSQIGQSLMWFKRTVLDFDLNKIIFGTFPTFVRNTFNNFRQQATGAFNTLKKLPSTLYNLNLDKLFGGAGGFAKAIQGGIANVRNLGASLSNVASQGVRGFGSLASTIGGGLKSGISSAGNALKGLTSTLADSAKAGLFGGAILGVGVGAGLAGMITYATQLSSKLQGARLSFEALLGDSGKARQLLTDITAFAKKTPFNRLELIDLSKLLLGSGILQKEIIPTLTKLGNVAAGSGAPIENLAYNYAQIRANNRAYTVDLKQFATYGIPIFDKIAKNMGITVEQLRNGIDSQKIKVSFADVEKALNQMTSAGGQYFDLMGKKSTTFEGALSNIQDTAESILLKFMGVDDTGNIVAGGFFDLAQTKALNFQAWLNANGEQIGQWGQVVFTKMGQGMQLAWSSIIRPALSDFQRWFDLGGKEAIKKFLSEGWDKFKGALEYWQKTMWPEIKPLLNDLGGWLSDPQRLKDIQTIANAIRIVADELTKAIGELRNFKRLWDEKTGQFKSGNLGGFFTGEGTLLGKLGIGNKRAGGGPVQPGKLYEVGENNKAEMLMMNGRQYMIPGNKGQVLNQQQIKNQTDNRQINSGNTQIIYTSKPDIFTPSFI